MEDFLNRDEKTSVKKQQTMLENTPVKIELSEDDSLGNSASSDNTLRREPSETVMPSIRAEMKPGSIYQSTCQTGHLHKIF